MGYSAEQSARSLKQANNDIDKAIDLLHEEDVVGLILEKHESKEWSIKNLPQTENQVVRMMLYVCD